MRKITALILAVGLLCSLFACAENVADTETDSSVPTDAAVPTENTETTNLPKTEPEETEPEETETPETSWTVETDALGRKLDPLSLPQYEQGIYIIKSDSKWEIWGVTRDDFIPFIDLLKSNGVVYDPSASANEMSEPESLMMDFWFGLKGDKRMTIFLMVDISTWENYFSVSVNDAG